MVSRQANPWALRARAACRAGAGIVLCAALLALAGCLDEASDKDYDYDNPNDSTPSVGSDSAGGMAIAYVDAFSNVVVIANQAATGQDMEGWSLTNEDGSQSYAFAGFTLGAGVSVRVHPDDGTDDADDLYVGAGNEIDWGNGDLNDTAILIDGSGSPVANCRQDEVCWP